MLRRIACCSFRGMRWGARPFRSGVVNEERPVAVTSQQPAEGSYVLSAHNAEHAIASTPSPRR
jgi:hypothetical protein